MPRVREEEVCCARAQVLGPGLQMGKELRLREALERVNELELESLKEGALGQQGWRPHLVSVSPLCDAGQVTEPL